MTGMCLKSHNFNGINDFAESWFLFLPIIAMGKAIIIPAEAEDREEFVYFNLFL